MEDKFIKRNGWEIVAWYNGNITYIHRNWNLENDSFFVEMKTSGKYVKIIEVDSLSENIKFDGLLKTNDELKQIMDMLEYEF